ncbi:MAG: glycosyltransferase [Erysipelotrichaceae bacterium]|nr:glycosyltransferase [Erysipelotrichaceae bacterium]
MKVSIIVPVFNEEKNVRNIFSDIIGQTMQDFEAIFIDDGSTDQTLAVLSLLKEQHPNHRIHLLQEQHSGVSNARNKGLDKAQGKYIAFVDGDDRIEPEYLQELYNKAEEVHADWVCCDCKYITTYQKEIQISASFLEEVVVSNQEAVRKEIFPIITCRKSEKTDPWYYTTRSLFRKEIIDRHNLRFQPEVVLGEDVLFACEYVWNMECFAYMKQALYLYQINEHSSTKQYRPNRMEEVRALIRSMVEIDRRLGIEVTPEQSRYLLGTISDIFRAYIVHPESTLDASQRKREYQKLDRMFQEDEYVSYVWGRMSYRALKGKGGQLRYFLLKHRLYELFRILLLIYRKKTGVV